MLTERMSEAGKEAPGDLGDNPLRGAAEVDSEDDKGSDVADAAAAAEEVEEAPDMFDMEVRDRFTRVVVGLLKAAREADGCCCDCNENRLASELEVCMVDGDWTTLT